MDLGNLLIFHFLRQVQKKC